MTEKEFIAKLKRFSYLLPKQTVKTLRGQALSGNVQGATKGLLEVFKYA